ncbi:hypothetical protein RCS94_08995 [Orbaceae bacterium ac157xtp]
MTETNNKIAETSEIKKASFWVSQLFILLATVVGVFLAANQGFQQAVQFENMNSYKENYYLQKSLEFELTDNIVILKNYINKMKDPSYFGAREEPLDFYSLIRDNMRYSQTTLGTPPELLRDTQRFYREVQKLHTLIAKGNLNTVTGSQKLQVEIDHVEQVLIPALQKSTADIKAILDKTDVVL